MPETFIRLLAAATLGLAAITANAADPSCQPLLDATLKLATTASHQTMTYQRGGTSRIAMEAVVSDKVKWMRIGPAGKWEKETSNSGKGLEELRKADCRYVRDDSADGEPAAVYEVRHIAGDSSKRVEQMWLSKSSGLPLRAIAGDPNGKSSAMTRFEYKGVKAPTP